jgi:CheY-like chemotaxis protein
MSLFRKRRTVVIVEPDGDARDRLVASFEDAGYHVLHAPSASEALRLLRACPRVDLFITELSLPGMTGAELISTARQVGFLDQTTPSIMYTAHAQVSGPQGVTVLRKPLDAAALLRAAQSSTGGEDVAETGSAFRRSISSYEFVRAMLPAGYRLIGTTFGHALLGRRDKELLVPRRDELTDDEVFALLKEAGVEPSQFLELLDRMRSGDTWPESEAPDAEDAARRKRSRGP